MCKMVICVGRRKKTKIRNRNTRRNNNNIYYEISESDSESVQNNVDTLQRTAMGQEVSLLGRRYQDTSMRVEKERQKQPVMGVMASKQVVDWLVYRTDKGERPLVSWDQIRELEQEIREVDIINNNFVKSDTFEDINKNTISEVAEIEYAQCTHGSNADCTTKSDLATRIYCESYDNMAADVNENIETLVDNMDVNENTDSGLYKTEIIAIDNDRRHLNGNDQNLSLFHCSQECFDIHSHGQHQRVVLPEFDCVLKM